MNNIDDWHKIETYKSMIGISVEGFKSLLLINGGAIIAILTYIGQSESGKSLVDYMWLPVFGYSVGVFSSVLSFIFSYNVQYRLYNNKNESVYMRLAYVSIFTSMVSFILSTMFALFAFIVY